MISKQYTGTNSNNTRVTIENKQGYLGKLEQWKVGIERYKQVLYKDKMKQECIQLMTCANKWSPDLQKVQSLDYGIRKAVQEQIEDIRGEWYRLQKDVNVNIACVTIDGETDLTTLDVESAAMQSQ